MTETKHRTADLYPFWLKGQRLVNFGDYLTEILLADALLEPKDYAPERQNWSHPIAAIRLVGSAIGDWFVAQDQAANGGGKVYYWGCGMREPAPIQPQTRQQARFYGIRGPLSRDHLDLPADTPIGDPGLLLPLLHQPQRYGGFGRVVFPHILESKPSAEILRISEADRVCRVAILPTKEDFYGLVDEIAAADFVLTGSLHVAIIAHAYNRPYAFWGGGYVDIPFKWMDFAAAIGTGAYFVPDIKTGQTIYRRMIAPYQRKLALTPLLDVCPLQVRSSLAYKAAIYDAAKVRGAFRLNRQQQAVYDQLRQDEASFVRQASKMIAMPIEEPEADSGSNSKSQPESSMTSQNASELQHGSNASSDATTWRKSLEPEVLAWPAEWQTKESHAGQFRSLMKRLWHSLNGVHAQEISLR